MKVNNKVRYPIVSGLFYPDKKEELEENIDNYLKNIDPLKLYDKIKKETGIDYDKNITPLVLITPHAGYIFSGKVQAHSYKLLENKDIDTVIIIGPCHQKMFKGISVDQDNAYKTPLGIVDVDIDFSERLLSSHEIIKFNEEAHLSEHSIEVQLPFIQRILPAARIVSILIGEQNWESSKILYEAALDVMDELNKKYVFVASSDLSHYHSHIEALSLDEKLMKDIKNMDLESFYNNIQSEKSEACGFSAILTGMMLSKRIGKDKSVIFHHTDSGEVSLDRKSVVGYLSAALF